MISQDVNGECGAIAICNVLSVYGYSYSKEAVIKTLKIKQYGGTSSKLLEVAMRKYLRPVNLKFRAIAPTLISLNNALSRGVVLLSYIPADEQLKMEAGADYEAHVGVVIGKRTNYKCLNMTASLIGYKTESQMDRILDSRDEQFPKLWVIYG